MEIIEVNGAASLKQARTSGPVRAKQMERYLTVFLGVLMLGSLGAFLLYVPVLPFAAVVIVLLSLVWMFILGVQTCRRRIRISR